MAKGANFHRGSSGSPKHTEVMGSTGFDEGHVGPSGIRIGSGVEGRKVTADYDRNGGGNGVPKAGKMSRISQGD